MNRKSKNTKKNFRMYNQTLYVVQSVVQVKWIKNRQYCLIKWKGYDQSYNTWEPRQHITLCYQECPNSEKQQDPQYVQSVAIQPSTPHTYQTRAKKRGPERIKTIDLQEKQDPTPNQLEECPPPSTVAEYPKSRRSSQPPNSDQLELKRQGEVTFQQTDKDCLVQKVLDMGFDQSRQRQMCKVLMSSDTVAKVEYSVLYARYPHRLIEYYEEALRHPKLGA